MVRLNPNPRSSSPSDPLQQGASTGSLNAGGTTTVIASFSPAQAVTYYAHIYVDNFSQLSQSNPGNDIRHHPQAIAVTVAQRPDEIPNPFR